MNNLKASLAFFSIEELSVLHKILKSDGKTTESIIYKFERLLLSGLWGALQKNDSYKDILEKIAKNNNIIIDLSTSEVICERDLYFKLFKKELDQMSAEEKEAFYQDLEKKGLTRAQVASLSGLATLGAAQASGIGVYLLASSTVFSIASLVGVTLPFAFYTGLSTAISYVIGPLGFLVLGYSVYKNIKSFDDLVDIVSNSYTGIKKFLFGDYERGTLAVKYIASMRFLLESNYEKAIADSNAEIERFIATKTGLNVQVEKNNTDLKIIYDRIYDVEQKLKSLNSEKGIINYKIKELQNKIEENNNNQRETEYLKNNQLKKLTDFKSILSK